MPFVLSQFPDEMGQLCSGFHTCSEINLLGQLPTGHFCLHGTCHKKSKIHRSAGPHHKSWLHYVMCIPVHPTSTGWSKHQATGCLCSGCPAAMQVWGSLRIISLLFRHGHANWPSSIMWPLGIPYRVVSAPSSRCQCASVIKDVLLKKLSFLKKVALNGVSFLHNSKVV